MFDGRFRSALDKGVRPIGDGIRRTGVSADHLTALGANNPDATSPFYYHAFFTYPLCGNGHARASMSPSRILRTSLSFIAPTFAIASASVAAYSR